MSAGARLPGTPVPMHVIPGADGLRIAADSWGDPGAPVVLLLHGSGQTRHAWKRIGERLASAGYHAVAFDARGHGDSEWASDGQYGPDAMIGDLRCVIRAFGDKPPALVGASRGGGTSLIAIGEGRVEAMALVLVDIAPQIEMQGFGRIQEFMHQAPEGFESLDQVADAIASYQPHRRRPDTLDGLAKNVRLGGDGRYYWHWDPRSVLTLQDFTERNTRLEHSARRLRLPTLLVKGATSDVLSDAGAQSFLSTCPHAEFVNVAHAAHMVAGDRNDLFGNAVLDFIARTIPSGRH
ncbi:MAG: alpha/beta hydrolase [Betaproteobacteria bacterium]|nr:alpha/beta hydrolase [Betaproteobacteria bacterium]